VSQTRYGFRDVISGFFELPGHAARALLPKHIPPIELHHGTAVLAVTCFDFDQSEVGPYGELVMAVLVSPWVDAGKPMPKSALYPYCVATTTQAAREHAIERWHLPHYMRDVSIAFTRSSGRMSARVSDGTAPVLDLHVTAHRFAPVKHRYQSFMHDDRGGYLANVLMEGPQSEHEDQRGSLALFAHAIHAGLDLESVEPVPFRELWMGQGLQTFDPLVRL
jgi:hypothetical protein